ncbi:MAG: penicillin-binding protein activator [Deltaproteobacteria bacterium]|nr:penicillin-binding protein activator [Deltaproteobacteria bacterium]
MNSAFRIAAAILLASAFTWGACRRAPPAGAPPVIGASLPLSGGKAAYGKAVQSGIDLAREEIKQGGGPDINVIYEDDRGLPADSLSAINKLIDIHHVPGIIGGMTSATAEPIIPVCNEHHVVLLSTSATKPSLVAPNSYFFRLWPSDNYDGAIMAKTAYERLGMRKVAVLYINEAYGHGITQVFEREFARLGGSVVAKETYPEKATDFRAQLTKIGDKTPDGVFLPGYIAETAQILRQALQLGLRTRFLGTSGFKDPKLIEIGGEAAEGTVFSTPTFDVGSPDEEIRRFVTKYRSRHGADPDAFAAEGYAALRVIALAMERAGLTGATAPAPGSDLLGCSREPTAGERLREAMFQVKGFQGPSGTITFEPDGDVKKPLRLMTVRGGKFVEL